MDKALFKKVCQIILVTTRRRAVMKAILSVCVVSLIIFACGVPVHCQDDSLVDDMKTIDGGVISVDSQNSRIVVKASEVMAFSVPLDAKIINADGFNMQLSDVKIGSYVTVDYYNDQSGEHILTGMEVEYRN
jgi:hypothetical protein